MCLPSILGEGRKWILWLDKNWFERSLRWGSNNREIKALGCKFKFEMKTRCFNLCSLLVIFGVHLNLETETVFWEVKPRPWSFLKAPQVILQCSQHWCTDEGTVKQAWTPLGASKERNVVWRIRVHNSHGRAESGDQGKLLLLPQEEQKPRESTPEAWWGLCATECGLEAALA